MNIPVCAVPCFPLAPKRAVAERYFKEIVVYITAAKITRSFQKESQRVQLVLQYQTPRRGRGKVSLFSTLPLYLDVKYIPWERKTFNQQIPWTHTHRRTHAPFPREATAAAGAWQCSVCCWRDGGLWAGKNIGTRRAGSVTWSHRCWNVPDPDRGSWNGMQVKWWLVYGWEHLCEGYNCSRRGPFNYADKSVRKSSNCKAPRIDHIWNKMHIYNKEGHKLFWHSFSGEDWRGLHCLPGLL